MKRQDKEIRMRRIGADVLWKITLITALFIFISGIFVPIITRAKGPHNEARIILQEQEMLKWIKRDAAKTEREQEIKRALKAKELSEKRIVLQEDKMLKRIERDRIQFEEERRRQQEEARRLEEERKAREARVKGMLWSGSAGDYQAYSWSLFPSYGWSEYDLECLIELWRRESRWNPNAHNSSSGAHGIPQALPASKMASHGSDYYTNGYTQVRWGLDYIAKRYGSPSRALGHSNKYGWY